MNPVYVFRFHQDAKALEASLRVAPPVVKVPGLTAAKILRWLHCVLLLLGGVSVGYLASHLLTGTPTFAHWGTAVGLALSYIAIFGSIFVTLPMMVRQILATRINQGEIEMTVDQAGVQTRSRHFQSQIDWAGVEGITKTKKGFVIWVGGNRPSIPLHAFESAAQIGAFELDTTKWLEDSR
ncbi:YcxB family protein [Sulfitobacter sp. F26169L]|uniref:YcxB family protein n=1 Tax=Sulfitobacter sp. F26169L TaxID=2996015 RepID=UPI0022608B7A|nr:YcxB family protein [Sulfitobacter sp. F26169L]MCX7566929.1 YcxB family protein [Sulfitobacter sp. F26169L]